VTMRSTIRSYCSLYAAVKRPLRTTKLPFALLHTANPQHVQHMGNSGPAKRASQVGKTEALDNLQRYSGWYVHPEKSYIAKALQFESFNDAWSVMTALALYSSRVNHHPSTLQVYNRVFIQIHTHSQQGPDKISDADIKMAKFLDRRTRNVTQLDHSLLLAPTSYAMETLQTIRPIPGVDPEATSERPREPLNN